MPSIVVSISLVILLFFAFSKRSSAQSHDLLFQDDFSCPSTNWQMTHNTWTFTKNSLRHDHYSIGAIYATDGKSWQNYEWQTTFSVTEWGNEHSSLTFFVRMQELWVGYGITINPRKIALLRYDGAWNEKLELGEYLFNLEINRLYELKVAIQANQIQVYLDNELLIDSGDPFNLYTKGTVCFYADYTKAFVQYTEVRSLPPLPLKKIANVQINSILDEDESNWRGYLPQGGIEAQGAKHILLWYSHFNWQEKEMLPYVAYGKRKDLEDPDSAEFIDFFYDTFLFLYNFGDCRTNPTDITQWRFWLEKIFGKGRDLESLNNAVTLVKELEIGKKDYKVKVILMIPYPGVEQADFGSLSETQKSLNFSIKDRSVTQANKERFTAIKWYLDQCLKLFNNKFDNLELLGFYWLEEASDRVDSLLIQETSEYIHHFGLKLFWIPMFDAIGFEKWQDYGFDAVIMQPNYFWPTNLKPQRLEKTAALARKYHMGIEIEYDDSVKDSFYRKRLYQYLDYGVKTGYMKDALIGYYEGGGGLLQLFQSTNPALYQLYTSLYQFAKGIYTPKYPF